MKALIFFLSCHVFRKLYQPNINECDMEMWQLYYVFTSLLSSYYSGKNDLNLNLKLHNLLEQGIIWTLC